jgi:hypothetical protein
MFLRFVIAELHSASGRRTGVFQAAYRLRRGVGLSPHDRERLNDRLAWFSAHLPRPERLAVSRRHNAQDLALCWFKPTARVHLAQAREMADILGEYGVHVDVLRTRRPGYVVYEDAFQVASHPFADTPS